MNFKSLISKIESIDGKIITPAAPQLPKAVQLNEDAELRVLAGTSSYITEAKKKAEEKIKETSKTAKKGKVEEGGLDMDLIKAAQKGQEGKPMGKPDAESDKNVKKKYGYRMDGEPAERDDDETKQERRGRKRKNTGENVDLGREKFKEKFFSLVEAKKKEAAKTVKGKKAEEKMDEAAKPDFLDIDKDGDKKEPMKKAAKEAGKDGEKKETKGITAAQKKLPPGLQKAIAAKKGKTESVRTAKKVVAESVESTMSLKDMLKIVSESGGQQQIDPVDQSLWTWANRVATAKIQESQKAEIFAAMIYERNGGKFEMYDVLAEDQK
jgi:hypothetical protein